MDTQIPLMECEIFCNYFLVPLNTYVFCGESGVHSERPRGGWISCTYAWYHWGVLYPTRYWESCTLQDATGAAFEEGEMSGWMIVPILLYMGALTHMLDTCGPPLFVGGLRNLSSGLLQLHLLFLTHKYMVGTQLSSTGYSMCIYS